MASARKSLIGILSLFFNRKDKKRRFHILHYEMWDYIAGEFEKAKPRDLRASNFVESLKESFCRVNSKNELISYDCYLCDFYSQCSECPLFRKYKMFCCEDNSLYTIAKSPVHSRRERVEAARKIRDCIRS